MASSSPSPSPTHLQSLVITYNCGRERVDPAVFSRHVHSSLASTSPAPSTTSSTSPAPPTAASSSSSSSSAAAGAAEPPTILVLALEEIAPVAHSFIGGTFLTPYFDALRASVDMLAGRWGMRRGSGSGGYVHVATRNVGMTAIMVFMRDDFRGKLVNIEAGGVGVGWYEMGNKGAVAVCVRLEREGEGEGGVGGGGGGNGRNGQPSSATTRRVEVTFVAAHLTPMEWNLERRNGDWRRITEGLVLGSASRKKQKKEEEEPVKAAEEEEEEQQPLLQGEADQASQHENTRSTAPRGIYAPGVHLIVAGDLNYRTSSMAPRPSSRAMYPRLSENSDSPSHYKNLLPCDQLTQEIKASKTLHGFEEAPIDFAPTYKYSQSARKAMALLESDDLKASSRRDEALGADDVDPQSSNPSSPLDWPWSPHRWPSWCDRILYLSCDGQGIRPSRYTSLSLLSGSDHQPVLLLMEIPWTAPTSALRDKPPFDIDPTWRQRRAAARRLEILTGFAAYFTTTWEGAALIIAVALGSVGGWMAVQHLLWQ